MVDSANLARLIDHAHQADAKLVLIGDPAQLGEIEAGGLFGSLVARTDPVVLDQVIRHEHDLDREGARRIREGKGAEAIETYRDDERVVVSPDPEVRREEMVRDWWRSYARGRGRADDREAKRRGRPAERPGAGGDEGRRQARRPRRSRSARRRSPRATR